MRRNCKRMIVPALVLAGALAAAGAAQAACISKGGRGTGGSRDSAMFQAWEAVLQATSWGSWMQFMASGAKVGSAPGYKVSNLKSKCMPGGFGTECVVSARLCN